MTLRFSLSFFWRHITEPLLQAMGSKHIVEIGADISEHSQLLARYVTAIGGSLKIIDCQPSDALTAWMKTQEKNITLHAQKSLDALTNLEGYDTVIIDGDHNWHTVHGELTLIGKQALIHGVFPLVILHDVGWPYGQRDLYHDPKDIPEEDQQRFGVGGMIPSLNHLTKNGGLNPQGHHALVEAGPRNGVRTAVEDFLSTYTLPLEFIIIPGMYGYGILVSESMLATKPHLRSCIDSLRCSPILTKHMEALEEERIRMVLDEKAHEGRLQDAKKRIDLSIFVESHLQQEINTLEGRVQYMQQSRSWRWTSPIRNAESFVRKIFSVPTKIPETKIPMLQTTHTACTIISKNYLAQALVWASSLRMHDPHVALFVLLVDEKEGLPNTDAALFTMISIADLNIPSLSWMKMGYSVKELNTGVKPFFLEHLLTVYGVEHLLYFDPDILITSSVMPLFDQLCKADVLLTPHVLSPIPTNVQPTEVDVLMVGVYNLGFIGIRRSETAKKLLSWWSNHLLKHCIEDPHGGIFVDQRWIDLVPALFDNVAICKNVGCNMAYWNLYERRLTKENGVYLVNGSPLLFFHFSGYSPEKPHVISTYFSTHSFRSFGAALSDLFRTYEHLLWKAGYDDHSKLPYAYGKFDNGTSILPIARTMYRSLPNAHEYGDALKTGPGSFYEWLQTKNINGKSLPWMGRLFPHAFSSLVRRRNSFTWYRHATAIIKKILDPDVFHAISTCLHRWEGVPMPIPRKRAPVPCRGKGVNMVGYFDSDKGVGQAARMNAEALDAATIPHVLLSIPCDKDQGGTPTIPSVFEAENPYNINLLHLNSDRMKEFRSHIGDSFFSGRRTIGFWVWELSYFPERYKDTYAGLDEIWTPSEFCSNAIRKLSPIPVVTIPHPVTLYTTRLQGREHFRIDPTAFVFLFCCDFLSVAERKNPLGVIEAFQKAFDSDDNVLLIIKCSNGRSDTAMMKRLTMKAAGRQIRVIDSIFSRRETTALLQCADSYVSLHRSEGFGLTIAESMLLGKPVIATNYSAPSEFLSTQNGFPVTYQLTSLTQNFGPYPKGAEWAEPNTDDAAQKMRFVFEHREEAARIAQQGQQDIMQRFSPLSIGKLMHNRLRDIGAL